MGTESNKTENEKTGSGHLQHLVSAISLDDAKPSSFMKELTESLAKKEAPLIDETRLKTGQDWSVLATQVVGCER
jgi:hypothetical protein